MKNIMFDFTPGTTPEIQRLIAQIKATGAQLDAATDATYKADAERVERKIAEAFKGGKNASIS